MSKVRRTVAQDRKSVWSAAFDAAERAYGRADYAEALPLLELAASAAPAYTGAIELLRARCSLYAGDYELAYAAGAAASRDCDTVGERLAAAVLQALAAKRSRKVAEARRLFASLDAEVSVTSAIDSAEARYLLALGAFEDDDFERARELLEPNLRANVHEAHSLALAGRIDAEQGAFREAGAAFAKAQRRTSASGVTDLRFDAETLASLATIAAETVDLELAKRARASYEKMEWPPVLAPERYAVLEALRTIALLEGDLAGAFFAARDAATLELGPAAQALAETRLAATARLLGDFGTERIVLRRAWEMLRSLRPDRFERSSAYALAAFAAEASAVFPSESRKAMVAFRSLVAKAATPLDLRLEAFGAVGSARVAESSGERIAALRHYRSAFAMWQRLGADLRTVLTALDLRRLTGDEAHLKTIRSIVARAPKAWFVADLKRARNPVSRLTPAERVVLARLLRGEAAKAIGEALERSPHTISNHTRKILAAFELNSRSKLIARCVELGITPEALEREG